MPTASGTTRCPWRDRFATPTIEELLARYEHEPRALAVRIATDLEARSSKKPSLEWMGVAWCWTLVFRRRGEAEPWAYLVPGPDTPTVAVPIPAQALPAGPVRRLPKPVREALSRSPRIGALRWTEAAMTSNSSWSEFQQLIDLMVEPVG
jgi:hypothetical protein